MDEQAGDNEGLQFTRKDSNLLVRIETEIENIQKTSEAQFKALHEKLDKSLEVKKQVEDKVNRHDVWIKVLSWTVGIIIIAVVTAVATKIFP